MSKFYPLLLLMAVSLSGCAVVAAKVEPKNVASPANISDGIDTSKPFMSIQLLGSITLDSSQDLFGISDLAWDEDEQLLYAISDFGKLFHLKPKFDEKGQLNGADLLGKYDLLDERARAVSGSMKDAEGLAVRDSTNGKKGDSELLVSFEGKPRIYRYDDEGGLYGELDLPEVLADPNNYKTSNDALEALTIHPQWGVLTSPERAMKASKQPGNVTWYNMEGVNWNYPMGPEQGNAVVAMEALPDGGVLVLERAFVHPLIPFIITLRKVDALPADGSQTPLPAKTVARFNGGDGWFMENFEGLTRHKGKRFFMVSDDNHHPLQRTVLVYFEVLE